MDWAKVEAIVAIAGAVIALVGAGATIIGVGVAYQGFRNAVEQLKLQSEQLKIQREQSREEYDWRRKQYAVDMLAEWNKQTSVHRRSIEAALRRRVGGTGGGVTGAMDPAMAKQIYAAQPTPRVAGQEHLETDWELRVHVIELLNYCEYVASSYQMDVADRAMLKASLGKTLVRWYDDLEHYVRETERHRGHNPWEPFKRFVTLLRQEAGA